jgi:hypothetical protein
MEQLIEETEEQEVLRVLLVLQLEVKEVLGLLF